MKFWKVWSIFGIYIIFSIVLGVSGILAPPVLSIFNLKNILIQASMVSIIGCGMVFVVTSGGFDLSIASTYALATCVVGLCLRDAGWGVVPSVLLALVCTSSVGLINGLIITKLKILPFVTTLATWIIIRGVAFLITKGRDINLQKYMVLKKTFMGTIGGIPTAIIIMFVVTTLFFAIYKFTPYGVYARAIGSNEISSRTSGIPVDLVIVAQFTVTGLAAGFAGVLSVSQTLVGNGNAGGFVLLFNVITATILGGTSMFGGKGNIWGMFVTAILLALIRNVLNVLSLPFFFHNMTTGLILIFAVLMNGIQEKVELKHIFV